MLLWALISSSLFSEWEIARLSQSGEIALAEPLALARSIRHYLNSGEPGLIQQHRLNNPERAHLLSVKQLLARLKLLIALLAVLSLVMFSLLARQTRLGDALHLILRHSALFSFTLALLSGAALLVKGFGKLFIQFHQLLFARADWVFPADSTLTTLFPPQLFLHGMLAWLAMMVMMALLLALGARRFT